MPFCSGLFRAILFMSTMDKKLGLLLSCTVNPGGIKPPDVLNDTDVAGSTVKVVDIIG